jgi:hypothetical protein
MSRRTVSLVLGVAASALLMSACGDASGQDDDASASLECLEPRGNARGALFEFRAMAGGRDRVDTSPLEFAESMFRRLADQVSAGEAILQDIDRWKAAVDAWDDGRSAIAPQIVGGRVVEPDTSELDRRLIAELTPLSERLTAWVESACEN